MEQQKDAVNCFLDGVNVYEDRTVDVVKKVLDGKDHVTLTFKMEVVEPARAESPRRNHVFRTPDGFCDYLKKYGGEDIVVLADPISGTATAVLNERAVTGFEVVEFKPMLHPFWMPWEKAIYGGGDDYPVKPFARFIAGQGHVIKSPDPKQLFMLLSQVRLSKKVTVEHGVGSGSVNGVMVENEVKGQSSKQPVEIPQQIMIHCPMFWGQEAVDIMIDVLVDPRGEQVYIVLNSADAEAKKVEQIEQMLGDLTAKLPDAVVTFGEVNTVPWEYVGKETPTVQGSSYSRGR